MKARDLEGVERVISEVHEGLKAAVERHFQGGLLGRGAGFRRNLLGMVGASKRKELAAELRAASSEVDDRWRGKGHQ